MYYVVTPEKPSQADKLHESESFLDMVDWAKGEAARRRAPLDVRNVRTGKIHASYGADGRNLPIREA